MQNKPLVELLRDLEQEMLRLSYSQNSIKFYRSRWQMLLRFAEERDEAFFSESLGMDFLEKHFHILEKDSNRKFSQAEAQELRIIRVIGDFQLHRTILRRYHNHKHREILTEPNFLIISNQFRYYCVDKGYSQVTTDHYVKQSARFMDYLVSQQIINCKEINLPLIHNYI